MTVTEGDRAPQRGPVAQMLRIFLTQLLAVVAVAAVIAVVFALAGRGTGDLEADGGGRTGSAGSAAGGSSPATDPGTPAAQSPAAPAPSKATPTAPAPSTAAPGTPVPPRPEVDVLNQSAGNGAAAAAADQVRAAGWTIGRVDDFQGNVSTTTVYWLSRDLRREARQLARDLGGVRVQEGFDTLVDGRLSLVLVEAP